MKTQNHFLILSLLVVTLGLALVGCKREPPALAATPPPVVMVSQPVEREITDYDDYTGRTAAVDSVEVRARVCGYLDKVNFKEGALVKKGDVLFEIDPRPYQAVLGRGRGTGRPGGGAADPAEADVARNERLLPKGAASQKDFDKAVADRGRGAAAIQAARGGRGPGQLDLDFTKVTAPSAAASAATSSPWATWSRRATDGTLLTTIVSVDPMYAYFDVDERTVLRVRQLIREGKAKSARDVEMPVSLGLANEDGLPHQGTINFVDNQVNPEDRHPAGARRLPQQGRGALPRLLRPRPGAHRPTPQGPAGHRPRPRQRPGAEDPLRRQREERGGLPPRPPRGAPRRPAGDRRRPEAGRAGDRQRPATGPAGRHRRAEAGGHADLSSQEPRTGRRAWRRPRPDS